MIISRTPTRISFFGGGTDYPDWYLENGGAVISTTINKYSYITVRELPPFFSYKHRIRYYEHEETQTLDEIRHPSVREVAKFLNFDGGLEMVHNADLPARSGLGSSSTFTVGMLHALYALQGYMPTKRELAANAITVEQERIGETVGSQDQIAAAFGGFNYIQFTKSGEFSVEPVTVAPKRLQELQENLLLCFTGFARTASEVAQTQISQIKTNTSLLTEMSSLADSGLNVLTNANQSLDEFGDLLDVQWNLKRQLSSAVSNVAIDEIYGRGRAAGATGGKLLGAGGGGFMLFYAPKQAHEAIKAALGEKMFVPFRFEATGSSIVYYSHG
jgi:D-glycero-alpha-D-manno-heptose-7-phosphate kinase